MHDDEIESISTTSQTKGQVDWPSEPKGRSSEEAEAESHGKRASRSPTRRLQHDGRVASGETKFTPNISPE